MDHRLVVRVAPEERVVGSAHGEDVIDIAIGYGAGLPASTRADSRHAEERLSICLPLASITAPGRAGSGVRDWRMLCTWMQHTLLAAPQCHTTHAAKMRWPARHYASIPTQGPWHT